MKKITLVIMAAGMGSRFGGLKQITPIGPNGEFIIDYSIYDAIQAGFDKIVFVIKKENQEEFKNTIESRVGDRIKIDYVYQELDNIPQGATVPEGRTKPWGTGHAVLCAKNHVEGPFAIINADDFYGRDSYQKVAEFLKNNDNEEEAVMISYPYNATSSNYGSVKRGIIELETQNNTDYVTQIIESSITTNPNGITATATPLDGTASFEIELTHPVSMNLFGFKENFMKMLEEGFEKFMTQEDLSDSKEYFLPETAKNNIANGKLKLKNVVSKGVWAGLTYKEDLEEVKEKITNLINQGEYPKDLWK